MELRQEWVAYVLKAGRVQEVCGDQLSVANVIAQVIPLKHLLQTEI